MSDNDPQPSPGPHDDSGPNASALIAGNGVPNAQSGLNPSADGTRGIKRPRPNQDDDDDDEDSKPGRERRKIEIKFIQDKSRRHITFSKRKAGIMKKVISFPPLCFPPYFLSLFFSSFRDAPSNALGRVRKIKQKPLSEFN